MSTTTRRVGAATAAAAVLAVAAVLEVTAPAAELEAAGPPTAAVTAEVSPARTATRGEVDAARAALPRLRVADDVLVGDGSGYEREARFGRWPGAGAGCDLRDTVLAAELTDVEYRAGSRCNVAAGELDGRPVASGDVDIDHVVPLRLAWSSGAAGWDDQRRRAFATDRRNLRVERSHGNRGNGNAGPESSDPAPGDAVARCRYGVAFVLVADGYGLSVTDARRGALEGLVAGCGR